MIIDVLEQAAKACVVRRKFGHAKMLINVSAASVHHTQQKVYYFMCFLLQEAVLRTREVFGDAHPKYAECLTDLGYYLLNVDQVGKSLKAYETALRVR